jgi:hypothetical protein
MPKSRKETIREERKSKRNKINAKNARLYRLKKRCEMEELASENNMLKLLRERRQYRPIHLYSTSLISPQPPPEIVVDSWFNDENHIKNTPLFNVDNDNATVTTC